MYGPHADAIDAVATHHFADALGYPLNILLTYRAAYAIISSTLYDAQGLDRHFEWCARMRDDIERLLLE